MSHRFISALLALAMIVAGAATRADAQGLTGQISGVVTDTGGGVMPGATVTVKNVGTNLVREAVTGPEGAFVITNLLAGTFDLSVTVQGFKPYEQKGIVLGATERLALRTIALEIGGLAEVVSVAAESIKVQTTSGERSATITASQIEDIGLKGRDFMGSLKTLPGVIDTSARDAPGWGSVGGMSINGQTSFNFSYDGVTNKDTGSNSGNYAAPALDSIAEVKVQASNFQAEYGRSSGATITVVTKSGTRDFRGTAAYYRRNEKYNTNTWDRRRQCDAGQLASCQKAPYRFDNTAWTIGGPVLVPGTDFNQNRDKLFFFFSQDLLPRTDPGTLQLSTMPTALERSGDFSQTFDSQNRMRWIKDPNLAAQGLPCNVNTGGTGCFPNNRIPADRINAIGQRMLNLFPMPNATDPTGSRQYNYTYQNELDRPRNDQVARVDYNINRDTTFYTRVQFGNEVNSRGANAFLGAGTGNGGNAGWPQFNTSYEVGSVSMVSTLLHTFNSSTVGEVTVGRNWAEQLVSHVSQDALDQNDRRVVLAGLGQFFPSANPQYLVPQISYGGTNALPNTRGVGVADRYPFNASNIIWNYSANVSKIAGRHNLKTGFFYEHTARPAPRAAVFNGNFNFNGNASNPFDTNLGFANALLGSINSYTESTAKPYAEGRFNQAEIFVQDNWRVSSRLTLDFGVRFYYIGPTYVAGQDVSYFDANQWASSGGTAALPAGLPEQRGDLRRQRPAGEESAHRRDPQQHLHRQAGAELRRLLRRHGRHPGDGLRRQGAAPGAAPWLRVGRVRRRQDVGPWRVGHLLRPLSGRHHPVARRATAAHGHADDELHDDRGPAELAADPEPARGDRLRRIQGADGLQLEHRRPARPALEHDRGRRVCRKRRPQPAGHGGDQRPAVRHAAAAAECRSDQRRSAGRDQLPASLPRLRRDQRARVDRLQRLPFDPGRCEPPLLAWLRLRRRLHRHEAQGHRDV